MFEDRPAPEPVLWKTIATIFTAFIASLLILPAVTLADEADELLRVQHVNYCFEYTKWAQDGTCKPAPPSSEPHQVKFLAGQCTTYSRQFQRMQAFLAGSLISHSTNSGWTTNVALAQASGKSDMAQCNKEIDDAIPDQQVCIAKSKDPDRESKCAKMVPAPTCQRLVDRCAKIDRELPY